MELRYGSKEEKQAVYEMYQEIFCDPEAFAEYYFQKIFPENQVLEAVEDHELMGMIHLNPYRISVGAKEYRLNYIVAVAVKKEMRRRGIMAKMLKKCLNDMEKCGQPFTYLMPANRAYYEPFGFEFVMDWHEMTMTGKNYTVDGELISRNGNVSEISAYIRKFLNSCGIYTLPDERFVTGIEAESGAANGGWLEFRKNGCLKGVCTEAYEDDKVYIRYGYSEEPEKMLQLISKRHAGKKIHLTGGNLFLNGSSQPKIMARITSLKSWGNILKGREDFRFCLEVEDPLIEQNCGLFEFQCNHQKISIAKTYKECDAEKILISDLTRVFFGYHAENILQQHPCLRNIVPAGPVNISEEV